MKLTKIVNGEGILNPDIAIVGEAPGAEKETIKLVEDFRKAREFVKR